VSLLSEAFVVNELYEGERKEAPLSLLAINFSYRAISWATLIKCKKFKKCITNEAVSLGPWPAIPKVPKRVVVRVHAYPEGFRGTLLSTMLVKLISQATPPH
jgi:hypothetical protein